MTQTHVLKTNKVLRNIILKEFKDRKYRSNHAVAEKKQRNISLRNFNVLPKVGTFYVHFRQSEAFRRPQTYQ
jgi:hypothetical protein